MIYENEILPVIYVYDEEISNFKLSVNNETIGIAYVWENEDVVHLHLTPVPHSFGKNAKCLFTTAKLSQELIEQCKIDNIEWVVIINNEEIAVAHVPFTSYDNNVNIVISVH